MTTNREELLKMCNRYIREEAWADARGIAPSNVSRDCMELSRALRSRLLQEPDGAQPPAVTTNRVPEGYVRVADLDIERMLDNAATASQEKGLLTDDNGEDLELRADVRRAVEQMIRLAAAPSPQPAAVSDEIVCPACETSFVRLKPVTEGDEVRRLREMLKRLPALIVQDACEMPGKFSPEEFPNSLVIDCNELNDIVERRIEMMLEALSPAEREGGKT